MLPSDQREGITCATSPEHQRRENVRRLRLIDAVPAAAVWTKLSCWGISAKTGSSAQARPPLRRERAKKLSRHANAVSIPAMCSSRRIVACVVFLVLVTAVHAGEYFPPPDSEGGWRTATGAKEIREKAGMDLDRLEKAYIATERSTGNGGLLVVRRGYLVFEKYFGRASRNANPDMASTGKCFTSIACGIMLHEFRERIPDGFNKKVSTEKYLPEALPLD